MTSRIPFGALVLCALLAACQSGDQPTTVTGRPAISPARRLVARIREDVDGQPKGQPGVDMVALDRNTSTTMSVGDQLRVELKANGGTGYQWAFVGSDADLAAAGAVLNAKFNLKTGEGRVEPLEPGKPGGPANTVFVFDAANAGMVTVHFALARPWEKGSKPADMRTLTVRVR